MFIYVDYTDGIYKHMEGCHGSLYTKDRRLDENLNLRLDHDVSIYITFYIQYTQIKTFLLITLE
jgi:hypothetical protein